MTLDQTNKAIALAQKNGGVARVNGIDIPLGELQQRSASWQEVNLNLASRKLAIQGQQMGLADELERRALMHMAPSQIDGIIKNGGKDQHGNQYNMGFLAQAYEASRQQQGAYIEQADSRGNVKAYQAALNQIGTTNNILRNRTSDLFGVTPREFEQSNQTLAVRLQALQSGYEQAFKSGGVEGARAYIQAKMPELQATQQDQVKMATQFAKQWGQGHPNMEALAQAYFTGTPLNAASAGSALVEMARFGIQPGTKMSPASARAFTQIQGIVSAYDKNKDAQAFSGKILPSEKGKSGEVDPALLQQVVKTMQDNHITDTNGTILANTGIMSQSIKKPDGTSLNASRMNPLDIQTSIQYGDQQGIHLAAQAAGVNDQQMSAIMKGGPGSKEYLDYATKHKDKALPFNGLASQVVSQQTQQMLNHLRSTPSGGMGFDPALALVEAWNHPEFQQHAMNLSEAKGNQTAGDYAIHQVANSSFGISFLNYADTLRQSYIMLDKQQRSAQLDSAAKLKNAPPAAVSYMAMHSMPNLNSDEANLLMDAVINKAKAVSNQNPSMSLANAIDHVVTKTKFQDPALDKMRAAAASQWEKHVNLFSAGMAGYLKSTVAGSVGTQTSQIPGPDGKWVVDPHAPQ